VPPRTRDVFAALLLAALAVLVFEPVTRFSFINFDDDVYVTENLHVRAGLTPDTVRWAFTNVESGHFHPLTWLTHAADVQFFGLDAGAHHRTTLLLHALATVLCFVFWRRMGVGVRLALFVGAVFAVHPLRIESVAWVATRKDVLSGVLFFATLISWTWWRARPGPSRLGVVLGLFLLALLSKPTVLPLPALLVLLEKWDTGHWRFRGTTPLFVASGVFAGIAVLGQHAAGAMVALDGLPLPVRLTNGAVALVTYAGRLLAPLEVSLFHPLRPLPPGLGVACGALVVGLTMLALRDRLQRDLAFAWGWFAVLLLPVCGVVQIGGQFIADRWLYLPLSGAVVGLARAWRWRGPGRLALGLALVGGCIWLTRKHLEDYRDSESVFRHALAVEPDNFLAHTNLGTALEARGALDEATPHYEQALRLNPTWPTALVNLGNVRGREGKLAEAEALFRRALARDPTFGAGHYNLALALMMQGRNDDAVAEYERAVALRPNDGMAALGYGAALVTVGRAADAAPVLQRSTVLLGSAETWAHYARALRLTGQVEGARGAVRRALELEPTQPVALSERGLLN
jgi:Flp pilus assembly protein TadD